MRPGPLANFLQLGLTVPFVSGLSLLPMQMHQLWYQRDMVNHGAANAADALTKALCSPGLGADRGNFSGARRQHVENVMRQSMAIGDKCELSVKPSATAVTSTDFASQPMDVEVWCKADCNVLSAAMRMCDGEGTQRYMMLKQTRVSAAMGCDGSDVW